MGFAASSLRPAHQPDDHACHNWVFFFFHAYLVHTQYMLTPKHIILMRQNKRRKKEKGGPACGEGRKRKREEKGAHKIATLVLASTAPPIANPIISAFDVPVLVAGSAMVSFGSAMAAAVPAAAIRSTVIVAGV